MAHALTQQMDREQTARSQETLNEDLSCLLAGVLAQVRWVVLAALLLLSVAQPLYGRIDVPTWALIGAFIGYNLLLELLRRQLPALHSFMRVPWLDLPVAAVVYALGATAGGPLYVLFLLITSCAAASMSLRSSLIYTAIVIGVVAAIAPTLPLWASTPEDIRELGVQLIVIGLVGVGMALLTRRLVQERLAAQTSRDEAERLAELGRLRMTFISTVSHDLRTPLTAIKAGVGMVKTSAHERLHDNEHRLLKNVSRNVERLDRHISDLLALNQIEANMLQLQRECLDLHSVVRNAVSVVQPLIEEKGQTLAVDLPDSLSLLGDPWYLERVVINLLCNAHEHTPTATQIAVRGHAEGDVVVLTVSDTGPGIPHDEQERIFQQFQRLSTARSGSGLGLAIVQGIIELHNGRVWLESAPGAGAAFHIQLPACCG
jgi:signal transduction histidine kinase